MSTYKFPTSYYLIVSIFLIFSFLSCTTNQPISATEKIVTIRDTIIVKERQQAATYFLVRHAEKQGEGNNPNLTDAGQKRATELARILEDIPLDAIYSTDYLRTMETATPTALKQNISITKYDPSDLNQFATSVLNNNKDHTVLIVGHSNTTPALINIFAGSEVYAPLSEKEYDHLYILTIYQKGDVEILKMKYGAPSEK